MGSMLLVLLAVTCISVTNVLGQSTGNTFSPAQELFLRTLLKEEAKGLRTGMMAAFSTPRGLLKHAGMQLNLQAKQKNPNEKDPESYCFALQIQLHSDVLQRAYIKGLTNRRRLTALAYVVSACTCVPAKFVKISTTPVCFGAKGDQFGAFNIRTEGFLSAIKLVHVRGSVTCDNSNTSNPDQYESKWGCATTHPYVGRTPLNTVITDSDNKILFPKDHHFTHEHASLWYNMERFDSNSDLLVFQRFHDPLYVADGQELRLWFGEDLKDVNENDNGGRTCAHIFVFYL